MKGEGRVPILFGSLSLPIPPNRPAYIARPDQSGSFATVVVACDDAGVTPGIKALARHLARHGYSVLVPELSGDFEHAVSVLGEAVRSTGIPGTGWADAGRIAMVGLGAGGGPAAVAAAEHGVGVLALVGAPLDRDLLDSVPGRLLVLHGADDPSAPAAEVRDMQADLGRGQWVLYGGVGAGFFDDASAGYDAAAAGDARDRLVAHLDARFGVVAAV